MLNQSPFSIYASAFLNRDNNRQNEASASTTTLASQPPLFYSATNGDEDDEDDPFRRVPGDETPNGQTSRSLILDEDGVPRLAGSTAGSSSESHARRSTAPQHYDDSEDDQPRHAMNDVGYDDDDDVFPGDLDALPMMDSEMYDSGARSLPRVAQSQNHPRSPKSQAGWKTHESTIAPKPLQHSHALSPPVLPPSVGRVAPPQVPGDLYGYDDDEDDDYDIRRGAGGAASAAYITTQSLGPSPSPSPPHSSKPQRYQDQHDPYDNRAPLDLPPRRVELNESLLPRDGVSRTLFYLPDPDRPVGRNKYHDSEWMSAWLAAVSLCALGSVLVLFVTNVSDWPEWCLRTLPLE